MSTDAPSQNAQASPSKVTMAASMDSVDTEEQQNCLYAFRITAAMEEIHSRCRQAKIFVPIEIKQIAADLEGAETPADLQRALDMWFPSMSKRDVAEAVKFAMKQAHLWDTCELAHPLQELIQFKHVLGAALEEIHPALSEDRREQQQVVELIMGYLGDNQSLTYLVQGLNYLYKQAPNMIMSLRHPVSRVRLELEHRHHSNTSIIETLGWWFRSKTFPEIALIFCNCIDRFCPEMDKDYLLNLHKGYDNLDVLLQTEQIILETGAHMYLESSDALLDSARQCHSDAFTACLQRFAPGFERIVTDPELGSLKRQLQAFKRWRRLYIWSDPKMIESDLPLETKQAIIKRVQDEVDLMLSKSLDRKHRSANRSGANTHVPAVSDPPQAAHAQQAEQADKETKHSRGSGKSAANATDATTDSSDGTSSSSRSGLSVPPGFEAKWDASISFAICGHDPSVPITLMRTSEERVVLQKWPQYVGAWRRSKKFHRMDMYSFRHSHRQLIQHFEQTVGKLQVQGLWNVLQVPEMIKEAVKIRGYGYDGPSDHRPRTVKQKMFRIWQQVAKWPGILNLPLTLSRMSGGMLNGYLIGMHPDLPMFEDTIRKARALFFAEPNSPPPRPAPPLLVYHSAIPAGRQSETSTFVRRTIEVKWIATDGATHYKLEYGRVARRVDWRRINQGQLLDGKTTSYSIGESENERLQEMMEYVVRLRAINTHGNSNWVRANVFAGRRDHRHGYGNSNRGSRHGSRGGSRQNSRHGSRDHSPSRRRHRNHLAVRSGSSQGSRRGSNPGSRDGSPSPQPRTFENDVPGMKEADEEQRQKTQEAVWSALKKSLENQLPGSHLKRQKSHDAALAKLPKELEEKVPTEAPFQAFVGGLEYSLSEDDVWGHFDDKCHIENVRLLKDEKNRSKGFCFIDFVDRASLIACLAEDGTRIAGRVIKVNVADHPIASRESSRRGSYSNSRRGSREGSRRNSRTGSRTGSRNNSRSRNGSRSNSRRNSPDRGPGSTGGRVRNRAHRGAARKGHGGHGGHGHGGHGGHGHGGHGHGKGGHASSFKSSWKAPAPSKQGN